MQGGTTMKATLALLWLGVVGPLAGAAGVQEEQEAPAPAVALEVEEWVPLVRKGVPLAEERVEAMPAEIARVELDLEVHRDFADARERLLRLWCEASTERFDGAQWELLVQLALARAHLEIEAQRFDLAARHLDRLLLALPEGKREGLGDVELIAPSEALTAMEREHLEDPRLVELREEVAAARGELAIDLIGAGLDSEDPYVQMVLANLRARNTGALYTMGRPALPILEPLVLQTPDQLETWQRDPLFVFWKLSGLRSARVSLAGLALRSEIWPLRVARQLEQRKIPGLYEPETRRLWGEVIEKLLADPRVVVDVLPRALDLYEADYRGASLEQALVDAWTSTNAEVRQTVLTRLGRESDLDAFLPLLEKVLATGGVEDRRQAADWIARKCSTLGALRDHVDDPDPEIRQSLAYGVYKRIGNSQWRVSDESAELLQQLATDGSVAVRRWVGKSFEQEPYPRDVCSTLARDPEPEIRRRIAELRFDDDSLLRTRLFEILAADSDSGVVARVVEFLNRRSFYDNPAMPTRAEYVGTVVSRLRNTTRPYRESLTVDVLTGIFRRFLTIDAGVEALTRVALEVDDPELLAALTTENPYQRGVFPVLDLPPDLVGELLARVCRKVGGVDVDDRLLDGRSWSEPRGDEELTAMLWKLSSDTALHYRARASALAGLARHDDPRAHDAVVALFVEEGWSERMTMASADPRLALRDLGKAFSPAERDRLARDLLDDPRVRPEPLDSFLAGYGEADLPNGMAQRILERFFDGTEGGVPAAEVMVSLALRTVAADPSPRDLERIVAALHQPSWTEFLVYRFGEFPDPRWLPLLGEALQCSWITDPGRRSSCAKAAANSLASQCSDEAAEVLLDGMRRAFDDSVRSACMKALERIREFREEEEKVHARRTAALDRDQAILDLLALLEDPEPEIRAEAARGLATLGAVDALPRLIRLLRADSDVVRAAAREAIERLHTETDAEDPPAGEDG